MKIDFSSKETAKTGDTRVIKTWWPTLINSELRIFEICYIEQVYCEAINCYAGSLPAHWKNVRFIDES